MDEQQLRQYFPNATNDFIKANADRGLPSGPKPKPAVCHESVATEAGKGRNPGRIHVRIISYRRRLLDPDNCIPKYFVDFLKYAEIIPDDTADCITVQTEQVKVKSKSDERTEILIE